MRIAVDARRIRKEMSGLGMYALHLIRHLAGQLRGNDLVLYILPESERYLPSAGDREVRRHVPWPPDNHIRGEWWKHVTCPKHLRDDKVDIFHDLAFQLPLKPTSCKTIVTIHDISPFRLPETNTWKYNKYWQFIIRKSIVNADRIITHSRFVKRELMDMFHLEDCEITVVPLAADCRFVPGEVRLDTLRKYGIQRPYLLTTANMEPRKNLAALIHAFHVLKQKNSIPHQLVLAGKMGWKCREITAAVEALQLQDSVRFTGYVSSEDQLDLIRGAEIGVVPSLYEGFGLPVLEYMACGLPVAASFNSSIPEVGGDAVAYFDPCSVEDMAHVLLELVQHPKKRERLQQQGVIRSGYFSWELTAAGTMDAYLQTVRG